MSPTMLERLPIKERRLIRLSQELVRDLDIKLSPAIFSRLEYAVPGTVPLIRRTGRFKVRTMKDPKMAIAWAIGQRVLAARERRGWTQQDLADKSEIARANIARLEAGKHSPKLDTLRRIALALGLEVSYLLKEPNYRPDAKDSQWLELGAGEWSSALEQEDLKS
ncbi:MAG: helix-turn-helix transcriptional regulator [Elusimicrobia bacterium]|nr:helix-turn-helix transcriptional regulator [Elusimicrobiota bacterium]